MYSNIFNLREAAKALKISISMMRKLIYSKEIDYLKIGSRYYIRECDLESFINNRVKGENKWNY